VTLEDVELVRLAEAEDVASFVADELVAAARTGLAIVLTGGDSPGRAYELAAEREPDWSSATLWWGDERGVPPKDERSNFLLARERLLDALSAPPRETHRIRGELGAGAGAQEYARELGETQLGVVLLGVGPDGHVASLFPNAPTLDEAERRVLGAAPGLDPWVDRITLTLPTLGGAPLVVFLLAGEEKADAARRAFREAPSPATPASLVRGRERTLVYLDPPAATSLQV
jgi:6-phosphogluconolactonase